MKKPMLGIITVCLMQIVFVAYNAIDLTVDTSAGRPVRETAQLPAKLDAADNDIVVFRSGKPVSQMPQVERTTATSFATAKRFPRSTAKPESFRPRTMLAVKKPAFRTEYPIATLESRESNIAYTTPRETKTKKNKSFFSKTLPVLKKPYDWAKAFAGMLK